MLVTVPCTIINITILFNILTTYMLPWSLPVLYLYTKITAYDLFSTVCYVRTLLSGIPVKLKQIYVSVLKIFSLSKKSEYDE